ncbi:peptidoglycan DD-metalloendopeptidase family protein [Mycobacterium sp. TY814]|uniref:peptidoglycan DD-metalloendopeptidase family protein n=1 Tax=unclassified Mycobacterium TaxID=2642494 RepID=UPI0027415A44|nr:peptidoglycan DD-metalloendopeptidase family protein [Mycobacterium sp. TY814]MDP7720857.1 peptidoglycan DD-metalloendopeptidase family protein [Mycobacterium sp. TY814]
MRVLGLFRVHNGEDILPRVLDSLSGWCDDIYVIDDRSTDNSADILAEHPAVTNVVRARSDLPQTPWLIPEPPGLELLYRMADFCRPDWIAMIDSDQVVEADVDVRGMLADIPADVAALMCPMIPTWHDPEFPDMIPIMGPAESVRGPFWRWRPELRAGTRMIHNPHWPANITERGRIGMVYDVRLVHHGWSTLAERVAKVDHYRRIDPDCRLNYGVPYDRALLFGYARDEVDLLTADYGRRRRGDFDPVDVDARLPIDREKLSIGAGYGPRAGTFHPGIDFAAAPGTAIHAVSSGTVTRTDDLDDRGLRSVTVSNAEADLVYVFRGGEHRVGDEIAAGAQIGAVGLEAESADGYLHFEVHAGGGHTSPLRYLGNRGLQPWPPQGRPRPVSGTYPAATPCTITVAG